MKRCVKKINDKNIINKWDKSTTISKYRNMFLEETKRETKRK